MRCNFLPSFDNFFSWINKIKQLLCAGGNHPGSVVCIGEGSGVAFNGRMCSSPVSSSQCKASYFTWKVSSLPIFLLSTEFVLIVCTRQTKSHFFAHEIKWISCTVQSYLFWYIVVSSSNHDGSSGHTALLEDSIDLAKMLQTHGFVVPPEPTSTLLHLSSLASSPSTTTPQPDAPLFKRQHAILDNRLDELGRLLEPWRVSNYKTI